MSARLLGKTILSTRPREQSQELEQLLADEGATTIAQPAIEILPPNDWNDVDDALAQIADRNVDWAIFSSGNGVRFTLERLRATVDDLPRFFAESGAKLAAVGSSTADVLRSYGLDVALVPLKFDADGLVDALVERLGSVDDLRAVSFRASRGRKTLSERLSALGAVVRETIAYRSVDATTPNQEALDAMLQGKIDVATVSSSASAKALVKMFGDAAKNARWAALSPLTADALRAEGIEPAAIAETSTMPSLIEAVVKAAAL